MPTFLPFLHSVKAPSLQIGVCALIFGLGANCLPPDARHVSAGPATGPLPRPTASALSERPARAERDPLTARATTFGAPSALDQNPAPAPLVSVDVPYPADARPRSQDPVQAAADDEELARWNVGGSSDVNAVSSQASYHPGTRVVVDTRAAKRRVGAPALPAPRGLTYQGVQAQARSRGYWPFRLCFELGERNKRSAGGEARVAFTIGTRGKVSAARLLDSKLQPSVAACLVRELEKLEFNPAPKSVLRIVASIRIYPGDAELPVVPDPALVTSLARSEFDADAARARLTDKQGELEACFAEARRTDPALWGRLALSVILDIDGSVHRVTEVESRFPNAAATRCAQILVSSLVFPSVNGKPFSFVIPLRVSPNPRHAKTGSEETPSPSGVNEDEGSD
jgi:hypothetical protein